MSLRLAKLAAVATVLAFSPVASAQTVDMSVNVQTHNKNGICFLYFPMGELELAISVKASNNNVNVGVDDLPAALVEAGVDKESVPITLQFANGKSVKTDDGSYRAGLQYKVSGYWQDSANGAPLLAYLKGGQSITAKFDGQSFGPFQIQQTTNMGDDYAYKWLKDCVTENGGTPNF